MITSLQFGAFHSSHAETSKANIFESRPGLDYVFEQIEKEGDIEGVIGYSEGSMLAATMLFDEDRRLQTSERPRRLKMGIFFNGWYVHQCCSVLILLNRLIGLQWTQTATVYCFQMRPTR